jgi:hypothetical protein
VQWCIPIISALGRWGQEDSNASLGYMAKLQSSMCSSKKNGGEKSSLKLHRMQEENEKEQSFLLLWGTKPESHALLFPSNS